MMILSQYHIFELDTINIYSAVGSMTTYSKIAAKIHPRHGLYTTARILRREFLRN